MPTGYPGMSMTSSEQADFIKNHLGPALTNCGAAAQNQNPDLGPQLEQFLPARGAGRCRGQGLYVAGGTAYHCYGGAADSQTALHDAFPDMGHLADRVLWLHYRHVRR